MKFKNKEELLKAYNELEKAYTKECQENKKLREQLKLVESDQIKIWQPKEREDYWYIVGSGKVESTLFTGLTEIDKKFIDNGNYFRTQEEAKKQAEYNKVINRFRKYCEAYSEPLDWGDKYAFKYFVQFNHIAKQLTFDSRTYNQGPFQIYASSKEVLEDAIIYSAGNKEEFIRIVFGVENVKN